MFLHTDTLGPVVATFSAISLHHEHIMCTMGSFVFCSFSNFFRSFSNFHFSSVCDMDNWAFNVVNFSGQFKAVYRGDTLQWHRGKRGKAPPLQKETNKSDKKMPTKDKRQSGTQQAYPSEFKQKVETMQGYMSKSTKV